MDLYEATSLEEIECIDRPTRTDFIENYLLGSKPVIVRGVANEWPSVKKWTLDYLRDNVETVQVQKPEVDGNYHYLQFKRIPFDEFSESLATTKNLYLSADKILDVGAKIPEGCALANIADDVTIPEYLSKDDVVNANLWVGPGGNKSLLHFDHWHSFLTVIEGEKKFAAYESSQTQYLYPYSVFDIKSLMEGRALDSKVNPNNVQPQYVEAVSQAKGVKGVLKKSDILFLPAGTWHYIESLGLNIAVNIFSEANDPSRWKLSPLKEFRMKTKVMLPLLGKARRVKNVFPINFIYERFK